MTNPKESVKKVRTSLPVTIVGNLDQALAAASWLTDSDLATVATARRLALALDVALDTGEIKDVPPLARTLLGYLQQLRLTVETRATSKQGQESDGLEYVGNYLRIINT